MFQENKILDELFLSNKLKGKNIHPSLHELLRTKLSFIEKLGQCPKMAITKGLIKVKKFGPV